MDESYGMAIIPVLIEVNISGQRTLKSFDQRKGQCLANSKSAL